VAGATISGLEAARAILRCRPESLLKQGGPRLQTLPCDDLSVWPENLTRKIKRRRDRNADTAAAV